MLVAPALSRSASLRMLRPASPSESRSSTAARTTCGRLNVSLEGRRCSRVHTELLMRLILEGVERRARDSYSVRVTSSTFEEAGHPRRWSILAVLCLSLLVLVVDNTVLNLAIPSLMRGLSATLA